MKKIKGITALIICAALLGGCGGKPEAPAVTEASVSAAAETTVTTTARATSAAALDGEDETKDTAVREEKPLVIAVDGCGGSYSPFASGTAFDELVGKACFVRLLGRTRSGNTVLNGVTGESELFGGRKYDYEGIADTAVTYDDENGTSTYAFSLRTDVKFADGEVLDADDVIFTLYAALLNGSGLADAGIVGVKNYIFNSALAEELTDEQIAEALASENIVPLIREKLMIPVLREQYENVEALYSDNSHDIYTATYPDPLDLFVFFYSADKSYEVPEGADKEKVISDIADGYGADYRRLAGLTAGDGSAFDNEALSIATGYLTSQLSEGNARVSVNNVEGIRKTGKFSLAITVRGSGRALEDALCALPIAPLHYYGDESRYDYEKNRFGFTKNGAAELAQVHSGEPMGAGAYTFAGYESDRMLLKANEYYYDGKPQTAEIKLMPQGDPTALISDGEADITYSVCSAELTAKTDEANRTLEKICTGIVSGAGYGYTAFDVDIVNVAGEPYSAQSCALRKALGTVISFWAADSVKEYFGDGTAAALLPSIGSVVIDTAAEDFKAPYTYDVKGEPIFNEDMNAYERKEALKAACLGFLEKAGYTVEDGKVTEAPEGGKLVFNAEYSSGGSGTHPAKYAFEKASELLSVLGITLNVTDMSDAGIYYDDITASAVGLGALSYSGSLRGKFAMPLSTQLAGELSELIGAAENAPAEDLQAAYSKLYEKMIYEYAAEVPLYERTENVLYSALRIDRTTLTKDMTAWYSQADELYRIKMK